jgi:hypothetical protein
MLEIAESNEESGEGEEAESSSSKKGKKAKEAAEGDLEEWSDRVKGILYELVDVVAERL